MWGTTFSASKTRRTKAIHKASEAAELDRSNEKDMFSLLFSDIKKQIGKETVIE